jgi:hypothetical protein
MLRRRGVDECFSTIGRLYLDGAKVMIGFDEFKTMMGH